jgi:hypothetical protein
MSTKRFSLPFTHLYKKGLLWNFIDSGGSQGLLIMYHIFFRSFAGPTLHGALGCTLSLFYLALVVSNFGLDSTLAPFLERITLSKQSFTAFIRKVLVPQLALVSILGGILSFAVPILTSYLPLLHTFTDSPLTLNLVYLGFVSESIRKTAKYFLQLMFYTRLTACTDLIGMAANLLLMISAAFLGHLSIPLCWALITGISLIQLAIFVLGFVHIYSTLPHGTADLPPMHKTRLSVWALQCLHQLFSGNFLVPVCAQRFGIEQASLLKVLTSISYWITLIAQKVFGISSNALLAHLKSHSTEIQREAFSYLSFYFNQALYALLIFLSINGKKLALMQGASGTFVTWSLLYFLLILTFFESFFILYEKWYIFEEKTHYYLAMNALSFAALYALLPHILSPATILLTVIILRSITLLIITIVSFYRWNIWPSLAPDVRTVLTAVVASVLFYLI